MTSPVSDLSTTEPSLIDVGLCGATGRMGQVVANTLADHPATRLAAVSAGGSHPRIGKALAPHHDVVLQTPGELMKHCAVVIDFSLPDAVVEHAGLCEQHKLPYVCGVTSLNDRTIAKLSKLARTVPVLWAPNMSVGVNLAFDAVRNIAGNLNKPFSVSILDIHHAGKNDAPSGTALEFGRIISVASGTNPEITYESVREGHNPGEHLVAFDAGGERLEVRHCADSRRDFADGAVRAALWLHRQSPGLYNMRNVLGNSG